ncbi:hypothetical protein J2TS6_25920 [Paenibacillus albilobatus]|uniref:DnaJ homologue subfamily C member 28 conserved domain-containing protein n=1 Tax=Paenibacillus albilobatus TaxID=2716884 RepID=A0A920C9N9_9BACL|nr:DUF1992 domain-containing protein [Paenibacillus albilobatus]GIO31451.1 hypothetical protein J2TS6_25920 [Paenibacillus albilobatus]
MDWNDRKKKAAQENRQHMTEEKHEHLSTREGMIESAVDEFAKNGGFDDLPGKGKPIKIEEGDMLTTILKNANVQPPWIELRKEIAADMKRVIEQGPTAAEADAKLEEINQKIRKYNRLVPNSLLQKGLVSSANLQKAYDKWV